MALQGGEIRAIRRQEHGVEFRFSACAKLLCNFLRIFDLIRAVLLVKEHESFMQRRPALPKDAALPIAHRQYPGFAAPGPQLECPLGDYLVHPRTGRSSNALHHHLQRNQGEPLIPPQKAQRVSQLHAPCRLAGHILSLAGSSFPPHAHAFFGCRCRLRDAAQNLLALAPQLHESHLGHPAHPADVPGSLLLVVRPSFSGTIDASVGGLALGRERRMRKQDARALAPQVFHNRSPTFPSIRFPGRRNSRLRHRIIWLHVWLHVVNVIL